MRWWYQATQFADDCTIEGICNIHIEHCPWTRKLTVKIRLDRLLVQRGLAATRSKAQDLIRRGAVSAGGRIIVKAGAEISHDELIQVLETERYVSRSAWKLRAGLDAFGFSPAGLLCLDIGSSTGGFTQVLLEGGAARIFSVDVGRDQLHPSLRADARVVSLESTDARKITRERLGSPAGAITCDVSFISLLKVLPAVLPLADEGAWLVALIKPQFEVGRERVGKGGIVKDEGAKLDAIARVLESIEGAGWTVRGTIRSPILGQDGNEETLAGATRGA